MNFMQEQDELKKRFLSVPDELDIVNIGSGPSFYDFDWSAVKEVKGYNLAVAPEDFRYDARIIMHYGRHLKRNAVVVVVVCPLSFAENEYLYKNTFSEKYVPILPSEAVDLPAGLYALYRKFPGLLFAKNLARRIYPAARYRVRRKLGQIPDEDPINTLVNGWLSSNRYLHDLKDAGQAECYVEVLRKKTKDLQAVIDNCRMQDLRPVMLLPPLSGELRKRISDEFIEKFVYENLRPVVEDGVPLLDYIDDERFEDASCYTNGLFLTQQMRGVFTRIVWDEIRALAARSGRV